MIDNFSLSWPVVYESGWFLNYYSVFKPAEMKLFPDKYIRAKQKAHRIYRDINMVCFL